jgi:hypothetical protein
MNGDGNIIAECVIVHNVDGKEEHNAHDPARYGNFILGDKKRRSRPIELRHITGDSDEEELDECQQGTCTVSS